MCMCAYVSFCPVQSTEDFSPPCSTCHEVDCDQFNNEKGLYKIENMDPMLCHCGPVTCHGPGS